MKEQFWKQHPTRLRDALPMIALNVIGLVLVGWTFARALGKL